KHIPFSSLTDFQEVSLTCMAPSKTFNVAGLCASVVIIPNQQLRDRFLKSMFNCGVFLGNVFGNVVLETCYNDCEDWLENLLDYLKQCKSDIEKFFELNLPQLKVADTEATFLTWIDFRNLNFKTHEALEKFIIEKAKIGLDTGSKFGEQGKFFMRLNFGCNRKTINEALIRLKSAIDQL
ncbi:MAG TPA: cystathionine beta-lyase, partial [Candidatus Cloacimonadota bacterium]|nr:cystathionine beta-lyase [Candidatus Cloacimonadota bacterium]